MTGSESNKDYRVSRVFTDDRDAHPYPIVLIHYPLARPPSPNHKSLMTLGIRIPAAQEKQYSDIYTDEALTALNFLSIFNKDQKALMTVRMERRHHRAKNSERITFLNPDDCISGTKINVQDAREGKFTGSPIPPDLQRQWIQGTGPAARPNVPIETSIRNVAYALLSGADGWMFDGEDALGQIAEMSLDNQRNLKLAIHQNPVFTKTAEGIAKEMNTWGMSFFGKDIVVDWKEQLKFTTKIFRVRGLHLEDRHICDADGLSMSASIAF